MVTVGAAEELWRSTFHHSPVGMALVELDGSSRQVNPALCTMLGYSLEELTRLTFEDVTHPEDLPADLAALRDLTSGATETFRLRKRYVHAEGHPVPADVSVGLVRDGDGQPTHLVAHVLDLSEEVATATRISDMNRELSDQAARLAVSNSDLEAFATLVSHDLQAPLATVSGYLQLLEDEHGDHLDAEALSWIQRADGAATRMSALLRSLLTLSRWDGELERVPVSVEQLVLEVCADLEPQVRAHGAVVEVDEQAALVVGDPAHLRQVLQNLIQNALKYRHPDRAPHVCVSVGLGPAPAGWTIAVDDNGRGIPSDQRDTVFALFSRLESADLPGTGHGIGLAACRRIVQRHGGQIWVEDNAAGPGSRFAFTLAP